MDKPFLGIIKAAESLGKVVDNVLEHVPVSEDFGASDSFRQDILGPISQIISQAKELHLRPGNPTIILRLLQHYLRDMINIVDFQVNTLDEEQKETLYSAIRIVGEKMETAFPGKVGLVDKQILEAGFLKEPISVVDAVNKLEMVTQTALTKSGAYENDEGFSNNLISLAQFIVESSKKLRGFPAGTNPPSAFGDFKKNIRDFMYVLDKHGRCLKGVEKARIYAAMQDIKTVIADDFPNWKPNDRGGRSSR